MCVCIRWHFCSCCAWRRICFFLLKCAISIEVIVKWFGFSWGNVKFLGIILCITRRVSLLQPHCHSPWVWVGGGGWLSMFILPCDTVSLFHYLVAAIATLKSSLYRKNQLKLFAIFLAGRFSGGWQNALPSHLLMLSCVQKLFCLLAFGSGKKCTYK